MIACAASCWVVGQRQRHEFAPLVERLVHDRRLSSVTCLDVMPASGSGGGAPLPELIVVLESHPDEWSSQDVQRLWNGFPLARIVCAFGPWSLSAGRTRSIWPAALRIDAAAAWSRVDRELVGLTERPAGMPLPITAAIDEVYDFDHGAFASPPLAGVAAAIDSLDPAYARYLETVLTEAGLCRVEQDEPGCEILLFDADPDVASRRDRFQQWTARHPRTAAILLSCTPWRGPTAAGCVNKLLPVQQLLREIERVYAASSHASDG